MIISIVFCEGVHDIAFIMKIMKAHGYSEPFVSIDEYPYPLSILYVTNKNKDGVYTRDTNKMPFAVLKNEHRMIVFHKMGGDSFSKDIKGIVKMYEMSTIPMSLDNPDGIERYEFFFFNDADDIGIADRVENICQIFDGKYTMRHGEKVEKDNFYWGVYIFHNPLDEEKKGDLEDLLLSLMEPGNESLFLNSRKFLNENVLDDTRKKKYDTFKDTYTGSAKKNYKEKKSIIGVAGQLQFSGEANTVMIEHSDYITKEKIDNSAECRQIFELIDL